MHRAITILFSIVFFFSACAAIAEVDVNNHDVPARVSTSLTTKGDIGIDVDSVFTDFHLQKDPFTTMFDLTIYENGIFKLTLSRADAISINISEDKYDSFNLYLSQLNKQIEEVSKEQ